MSVTEKSRGRISITRRRPALRSPPTRLLHSVCPAFFLPLFLRLRCTFPWPRFVAAGHKRPTTPATGRYGLGPRGRGLPSRRAGGAGEARACYRPRPHKPSQALPLYTVQTGPDRAGLAVRFEWVVLDCQRSAPGKSCLACSHVTRNKPHDTTA